MTLQIVSGTAHRALAEAVAGLLGLQLSPCLIDRFPDGELRPQLACLRGADVYVIAPTAPAVNEHVVELLLLLDACRRCDAARITAVMPYFGYARQDRRSRTGEPVGARVVSDALVTAGAQRLVVVDPHTLALEAMCTVPVEMLTAVPTLVTALASSVSPGAVVVAPDRGAIRLAEHYATLLDTSVAVVRKTRKSPTQVRAEELTGDVGGRAVIIVDDMITTGATIEAAARALLDHGARPEMIVAATHSLLIDPAAERLAALPLSAVFVTDSVAQQETTPALPVQVHSIAPLLADAVGRLHRDQALDDLLMIQP
jgi:ribose-phosphate pyrophosphokinase